jgi:hypothetical protein
MKSSRPMIEDVIELLRKQFGEEWIGDEEANLRFSIEVEQVLRGLDGVHLIGEPELLQDRIVLNLWVDAPIEDLMGADQLAYDIFGRISEEIFFAQRLFDSKSVRYPFVTGSQRHGHAGSLVLSGPHAADFADRHHLRVSGGTRFHAEDQASSSVVLVTRLGSARSGERHGKNGEVDKCPR